MRKNSQRIIAGALMLTVLVSTGCSVQNSQQTVTEQQTQQSTTSETEPETGPRARNGGRDAAADDRGNRQDGAEALWAGRGGGPHGLRPLLLVRERMGLVAARVRRHGRGVRPRRGLRRRVGLFQSQGDGRAESLDGVRRRRARRALLPEAAQRRQEEVAPWGCSSTVS